ncbi:MAG: hypothetical protein H8E38_01390 [SAR324 cluster bacterium]|nr:hypothetical protein [SAR324 cluster bacterium]
MRGYKNIVTIYRQALLTLLCVCILTPTISAAELSYSAKSLIASQNNSQSNSNLFFNRLRIQSYAGLSANCAAEIEYELFPGWISSAEDVSSLSISNSNSRIYRIADLNHSLTANPAASGTKEYWLLEHNLDRALLRCQAGDWEYTVGRQAVTFGGMSVSPTDVFVPLAFKSLDQEFRPGVDGFRIHGGIGETTEVEAGLLTGKAASAAENGIYLRSHLLVGSIDLSPLLASFKLNQLFGLTLQTDLGQLGLVFDGAYIRQRKSALESLSEQKNWIPWTLGLNLQWSEKLFTMLDYHRNAMGTEKTENYLSNAVSTIYQEFPVMLLSRDYLLLNLSYQHSPLLSVSNSVIFNLNDSSFLNNTGLEWSFSEDLLFAWQLSFASGKKSASSVEKSSEFGDTPSSFKFILKHYL